MNKIVQNNMYTQPLWLTSFQRIGAEERHEVANWRANVNAAVREEREFLVKVDEALAIVTEDYSISRVPPVWYLVGKKLTFFDGGEAINEALSAIEWAKLAKEFAPLYQSDLANRHQAILYYAYCIAAGRLTLQQVTGSTRPRYIQDEENVKVPVGNIRYSAVQRAEKKAALNTRVVYDGDGFAILGGGGNRFTSAIGAMADVFSLSNPNYPIEGATCLITVRK